MDIKNPFPTTKSTFKDISFFGVLNWVEIHSQIEKYVEIISTPRNGKVSQGFPNSMKGVGEKISRPSEEWFGKSWWG